MWRPADTNRTPPPPRSSAGCLSDEATVSELSSPPANHWRMAGRTGGGVYREQRPRAGLLHRIGSLNNSTRLRSRRNPLTHSHNASAHTGAAGPTNPINKPNTTSSSPSTTAS